MLNKELWLFGEKERQTKQEREKIKEHQVTQKLNYWSLIQTWVLSYRKVTVNHIALCFIADNSYSYSCKDALKKNCKSSISKRRVIHYVDFIQL